MNVARQEQYKNSPTYKGGFATQSTSFFQTLENAEKKANSPSNTYIKVK